MGRIHRLRRTGPFCDLRHKSRRNSVPSCDVSGKVLSSRQCVLGILRLSLRCDWTTRSSFNHFLWVMGDDPPARISNWSYLYGISLYSCNRVARSAQRNDRTPVFCADDLVSHQTAQTFSSYDCHKFIHPHGSVRICQDSPHSRPKSKQAGAALRRCSRTFRPR